MGIALKAQLRDLKENLNSLKKSGFIPAVMYGPNLKESVNLKINTLEFEKVFNIAGESNLIDLALDGGKASKIVVKSIQVSPLKNRVIHVDLYEVDMNKEITAMIPLNFVGEPRAIKELGAIFIKNMDEIEIECLPGNLVNQIDIDVTGLANFGDAIRLGDITLPNGVKLTHETNDMIATVIEPKEEVVEERTVEDVVVEGEEKKEGEEAGGEAEEGEKSDGKKE